jgi:hypothetical protein
MVRALRSVLAAPLLVVVLVFATAGCASTAGSGPDDVGTSQSVTATGGSSVSAPSSTIATEAALAALRVPVEGRLKQPVRLESPMIRRGGTFVYLTAEPVGLDGSAIDYAAIPEFAPAVEAGAFDSRMEALLRLTDGKWQVLEYRIGPTDTAFEPWTQKYGIRWDPEE